MHIKVKSKKHKLQTTSYKLQANLGFTLLEMLVAMSIFVIVITATISALIFSIRAQRLAIAEKEVSENVNFALEFMSRKMRTARRDSGGICITAGNTFNVANGDDSRVDFYDASRQCAGFYTQGPQGQKELWYYSEGLTEPARLTNNAVVALDQLNFAAEGETDSDGQQPRITVSFLASSAGISKEAQGVSLNIQTTVTIRVLDE